MSGANWANPVLTSTYVNYTDELKARDVSAMTQMRSSLPADTSPPTSSIRWNDTNFNWESWNGTAWAALATTYGINISGNAATATNSLSLGGALANTYAPLASPAFTGTPSLPTGATGVTQALGDNTTKFATTAFVFTGLALKADLASPTFSGTPYLPTGTTGVTQAAGDNTTKIATTAFVLANAASFPAGTRMTFNQTAAPLGWTKDTTAALNDSIMRIVTGAVGSGGSAAFTTWNAANPSVGATTLTEAQIPSHTHTQLGTGQSGIHSSLHTSVTNNRGSLTGTDVASEATGAKGGGGSHTHTGGGAPAIKYNDFIIASKN